VQNFAISPTTLLLIVMISVATAPVFGLQSELAKPSQAGQDQVHGSNNSFNPSPASSPAFSAEKYIREVRNMPDGKQIILSESRPMKIARSAEGQIRVEGGSVYDDCSQSGKSSSPCSSVGITVFNPATQTVTHWLEGSIAGHSSVVLQITSSRAAEIEEDTTSMPDESAQFDTEGATVTTQDLGRKTIEGISAIGLRTIVTLPARARGNKDTITTAHEVWTSTEMNLVVKIVDARMTSGDPNEVETIRGLDHVDLTPEPSLFQAPKDYEHQEYAVTNPGKPGDRQAERDMPQYAAWFVK
jgi:hypothetical protein